METINLKVMSHFFVSLTQHCHFTTIFDHYQLIYLLPGPSSLSQTENLTRNVFQYLTHSHHLFLHDVLVVATVVVYKVLASVTVELAGVLPAVVVLC